MNDSLLKNFIPMVDFLANVLGEDAEVLLHTTANIDKSIIAIKNGHISGRKINGPATNLVLKILKDSQYSESDFISNYESESIDGKPLKCSTFLIRNDKRDIIGILCININIEKHLAMKSYLDSFFAYSTREEKTEKVVEHFSTSVEELTFSSIDVVINQFGVAPHRLNKDEKLSVIRKLYNSGIFVLKGAVNETAKRLSISEASVYRYLNSIKKEDN